MSKDLLAQAARSMDRDLESVDARILAYGQRNIDPVDTLEIAVAIYAVADFILKGIDARDTHNIDLFQSFRDRAERLAADMHGKLEKALSASPRAVERPADIHIPAPSTASRTVAPFRRLEESERQEIVAEIRAGNMTLADIARKHHIKPATAYYYKVQAEAGDR